jgi:hypothetical protein
MGGAENFAVARLPRRAAAIIALVTTSLVLPGCAQVSPTAQLAPVKQPEVAITGSPEATRGELEKATEYWGKEFA